MEKKYTATVKSFSEITGIKEAELLCEITSTESYISFVKDMKKYIGKTLIFVEERGIYRDEETHREWDKAWLKNITEVKQRTKLENAINTTVGKCAIITEDEFGETTIKIIVRLGHTYTFLAAYNLLNRLRTDNSGCWYVISNTDTEVIISTRAH